MSEFLGYVYIGLGNGSIYALLGLGLVVIYRSTGLLNFAQGELAMFCTFLVWTFNDLGLPLGLALLAGIVAGFGVGAIVHQVVVRPLGDPHEKPLAVVIVTIGLFLGVNALAQLIWGTSQRKMGSLFGNGEISLFGAPLSWAKIGSMALLGVAALLFWLLFQKTKLGLAMRSVASNPESSALVGVPVTLVLMIGWGLAASLGSVAGTMLAPNTSLDTNLMQVTLIFAFAAITLGGFDSLIGAVVGGLVIGVLTDVVPRYVGAVEKIPLAPAFITIMIVLMFRPEGLFGSKEVTRV